MSEKADALFGAAVTVKALTDHFHHRFLQLLQAKGVKHDGDYELIGVWEFERQRMFQLKTEHFCCDDTDTTYTVFPLSDLDVDIEELNRRETDRLAKERAAAQSRRDAEYARQANLCEQRDQAEFKRLSAKYAPTPTSTTPQIVRSKA